MKCDKNKNDHDDDDDVEWSTCFILCCKLRPLLKMTYSYLF